MPVWPEGARTDYLQRQTATARNIRGGRVIERAFGGLNYQIEHHLFPTMPVCCLKKAKPIVEQYCREHGLAYAETGLVESYSAVLRHLAEVTNPSRQ
ncbi:fatty acid desaturase family protein [Kribbella monticola]|uniref:fatty acid desaturase family protein n=1 Tax=Kribbella monticola TaxID=2185285 RepID=UPI000DD37E5E